MSTITMTNTDPGEGSSLSNDNYLAVYGGSSILDMFYPVGCFFETTDTNFDPNVVWGGVWVEDSAGRVTVAKDTGTFSTVGDTGGVESVSLSAAIGSGQGDPNSLAFCALGRNEWQKNHNYTYKVNGNGTWQQNGQFSHSTPVTEDNKNSRNVTVVQPYIVVKRWHRTA